MIRSKNTISAPETVSPFPGRSEMAALMRSLDWSMTGLPASEQWPESLKAVTYRQMTLGKKHPWALDPFVRVHRRLTQTADGGGRLGVVSMFI